MKVIAISISLLILLCQSASAQVSSEESMSAFTWLEGTWERLLSHPNQTGFEEWERVGDLLQGTGVTIQQGDTVFVERLSIERRDDEWYYVADVEQNPEPVFFLITDAWEAGFVSENPMHDFPKKIEYQLSDDNSLIVTISGDGRSDSFMFQRH